MTADRPFEPLSGSPDVLDSLASGASRAAAALSTVHSDLVGLDTTMTRHRSAAVDTARAVLDDLMARVRLSDRVLRETAHVLADRAAGLAREQHEALQAIAQRQEAWTRVRRAEADEAAAWRLGLDMADLRHLDAARLAAEARARRDTAHDDVLDAERRWYRVRETKETSSRVAARRLGGLGHPDLVRWAVADGTTLADLGRRWADGVRLAERLSAGAVTGADPAERQELREGTVAALGAAGDDPVLWTALWERVGPAELYAALGVRAVAGPTREALATGLAAWAQHATPTERYALGNALVSALPPGFHELGDRADLAAALLRPALPADVHRGAADALVERHGATGSTEADTAATGTLTVAVATGLAADPDAALRHLAPPGTTAADVTDRAHAWFGVAPPDGWPDGGTAVTALLAAAVGAGTHPGADAPQQVRAALATSAATTALVAPGGLLAGAYPVSDAASRHVAAAYAPYLVSADDAAWHPSADGSPPAPGVRGLPPLAEGAEPVPDVVQPRLDAFALRDVVAATSTTETASGHWLRQVDVAVAAAAATATAEGVGAADAEALAQAGVADGAAVVGSIASGTISVAQDAAAEDALLYSTGLNLATTPVGARTSLGLLGLGTLLPPLGPDHVGAAREEVLATEDALRERVVTPFETAWRRELADRGLPPDAIDDAARRWAADSQTMTITFRESFDVHSGLGRRLGERS
ncbi:hypothetical protein [Isoptericola sp. b408]|uniref:hypothetical protein n=1 Tax=Isoptericola sp. b408 TaxID=3064653 RepID=UPI00271351A3|nr:hypothetical protein [Isoptericola sp. b408]MDO8150232.1 hypothetical protein [Isoptericola sp. b408]